jgi:hypothetical protein
MIPAKKPAGAPPKFGDVAGMCERVDRLGNVEQAVIRIERKVDMLVDAFLKPTMRHAINTALTSESLRALRK